MSFWTSPFTTETNGWTFNSSLDIMQRIGTGSTIGLFWNKPNSSFSANKTYIIKTKLKNIASISANVLSVNTSWNHRFRNPLVQGLSTTDGYLTYYTSPSSTIKNDISHFYTANDNFNNTKGILSTSVTEIDWNMLGFSWVSADTNSNTLTPSNYGRGWMLYNDNYWWYYNNTGINPASVVNNNLSVSENYLDINCLYKYIPAQRFNLEFIYSSENVDLDIYLSETPPYNGTNITQFNSYLNGLNKVLSITGDQLNLSKFLVSLTGNQYVIIVSKKRGSVSNGYSSLFNLKVSSGYHPQNNQLHITNDSNFIVDIPDASFYAIVGDREGEHLKDSQIQLSGISSKIGNGTFTSGIWENGVWNNGWRKDEQVKEFFDIEYNIQVENNKWQIKLIGLNESVGFFKKGDLISIGNIVAIDINEERKQLIDSYRIIDLFYVESSDINNYNLGSLIIEIETIFPIRRIEKDSINHRILVTKNIWLSGAFFNGYFTGVWNYGLLKGYPLITEMYNTHWKEGFFEGGHFNSEYISEKNEYGSTFYDDTKLGLVTVNDHRLKVGDVIFIDKLNKTINPLYDGETTVIKILTKKKFVTNKDFNVLEDTSNTGGYYYNYISSSVIQNMNFKGQNISKITSNLSLSSTSVFSYNSWIDTNYNSEVAVNIGKPQNLLDPLSRKSYAENNLYGYETKDILSSISEFRNSYSLEKTKYKLGTKYKVYKNYIGDASLFQEYFDTNNDVENFISQGWTFSYTETSVIDPNDPESIPTQVKNIRFQRTIDEGIENIVGQELKITATASGGVLNIVNNNEILIDNRELVDIEKNRYSKIEFELVKNYSDSNTYIDDDIEEPILHFNNLNYTTRDNTRIINTGLPIYENVNLLNTTTKNKKEYFFNKRNLSLYLRGNGENGENESSIIIKKLNFLETDMIPFFKYFTEDNINKSIQIPYQGIAPLIDYNNTNFVFLDNIKIGLDSFDTINSYDVFAGVGNGVNINTPELGTQPVNTVLPSNLPPKVEVVPPTTILPSLTINASYSDTMGNITVNAILNSPLNQTILFGVRVTYITLNNQVVQTFEVNMTIGVNSLTASSSQFIGYVGSVVIQPPCLISITPNNLITSSTPMCNIE